MKRWSGEKLNQPYWKLTLNRDWQNRRTWHQWLPPLQRVWWTGFSAANLHSGPSCERRDSELQHPPHQLTLDHQASGHSTLSLQWLPRRTGSGRSPSSTLLLTPFVSLPWGGLACASAPQAHVCYMFPSGISKGAQRIIPRILDIGQGSPIIGSASRVCATCISCTAF